MTFKTKSLVALGVVVLLFLTTFFGSWYTVDQGDRGIVLLFGKVQTVSSPGLHFKLPYVMSVVKVSTRDSVQNYDNVESYSQDQQPTFLRLSVNYRIPEDRVTEVYARYGSQEAMVSTLIDRQVYDATKIVFGKYSASRAIQQRGTLVEEFKSAVINSISGPVEIQSVQVENIKFDDSYEAAIRDRMSKEVAVQAKLQEAEKAKAQAAITVTNATAEANSKKLAAEAEASAIRMRGQAEADAIRAKAAALGTNPEMVSLLIAQLWDGHLPQMMPPGGTVPFVNLK